MSKKGFTLVEILVSASLLVLTAASFFYIFKTSLKMQKEAEDKLKATYAVQSKMEELRSLPFETLHAENGRAFNQGKGQVKVVPIDSELLEIQASLNWKPGKNPIAIYTMRTR